MRRVSLLPPISIFVVGDGIEPHFAGLTSWLARQRGFRVSFFDDADCGRVAGAPTLVLLLQSRPGQFTAGEIEALRMRWPLARFAAVFGSWCEGEPRSGKPLAGVYRIAWDAAVGRLSRELPLLQAGRGALALPATATFEERAAADDALSFSVGGGIAVAALNARLAEPVIGSIAAPGRAAFYWPLNGGALASAAGAVVWDVTGCEFRLPHFWARLPARADDAPLVALVNFPRPQDDSAFAALGVSRVLGKPFNGDDLFAAVGTVADVRGVGRVA